MAQALGKLGDAKAIEPLRDALDDKEFVKHDAMIALARLGDKEGFNLLIESLSSASWGNKIDIVNALGDIGNKEAIEPLKQELKIEREGIFCQLDVLIALALAKLGNQDGRKVAVEYSKSSNAEWKAIAEG